MKKNTYTFRKLINDIHLWLGIGSGIIIFLVCFSGTILAFEHEIKDIFSSETKINETENKKSVTDLIDIVKNSNKGFVTGLSIPNSTDKAYTFSVKKSMKERRGSSVLVNPYSGALQTVEKTSADAFLFSMFKLHRWLLLDSKIGRPIVGIATIIFLILSITGIILWFPRKLKWKNLKPGLKIKTDANWKRINHDLHNTLGFYACIFIVIMGITGLCWSFEGYRNGLGNLIGTKIFNRSTPKIKPSNTQKDSISVDEVIKIANKTLNYNGTLSVTLPNKKNNYYSFRKTNTNNWSPVTTDKVYIDTSGQLLAVDIFNNKPLNVKIAALIKPIHTGEIFGTTSKILYFIACLIGTSLPITGTIIWINKLKKKKKRN
ncbi:PepSY domain-containing protein [Seonamhaeicola algicola]|uniref:PepSY domain-containing protein n=1 Tax=Seonamhaeicola algicola TaxID=1719036 RepID=A0A5C7AMS6_9FLAO|nr:PepSY-associated TM helix domain-containing protein [Seonamhaeicola algicola]TXE10056.1 PepSY domain-containing protein [Seonamhaeicola algicola]